MSDRPYFHFKVADLRRLWEDAKTEACVVAAIVHELSRRRSSAAKSLLAEITGSASTAGTQVTGGPVPPKPVATTSASFGKEPFPLTEEQQEAVDCFLSRRSLKVNAFAGAGKTSTLAAMARRDRRSGLYLAFNRSIAKVAGNEFPHDRVDCRTTHSLAFQFVIGHFRGSSKLTDQLNGNAVAQLLGLTDLPLESMSLRSRSCGALVLRTLRSYCYSADTEFSDVHIPRWGKLGALKSKERLILNEFVREKVRQLWNRMIDPEDQTPMGHDGYLKLWALSEPRIGRDYILLDEAQDTNEVVLDVLQRQSSQRVYVGDAHQQIYEWRGAINAMERIETERSSYLTMSFRFGDTIAAAANKILRQLGERRVLKGNPHQVSTLGTHSYDASLSRTNAMVMSQLLDLLAQGKQVSVVGGTDELKRLLNGVMSLQSNEMADVPELFGYASWDEVRQIVKAEEGHELTTLVSLVEKFDVKRLLAALGRAQYDETKAAVVLSTVHKAKGRQWNRVNLTDDFVVAKRPAEVSREELRIAYVAVTRAKEAVNVPLGIRNAFAISQDPRYDSSADGSEHRTATVNRHQGTANQSPAKSGMLENSRASDKQRGGWLTKLRDFFRSNS